MVSLAIQKAITENDQEKADELKTNLNKESIEKTNFTLEVVLNKTRQGLAASKSKLDEGKQKIESINTLLW